MYPRIFHFRISYRAKHITHSHKAELKLNASYHDAFGFNYVEIGSFTAQASGSRLGLGTSQSTATLDAKGAHMAHFRMARIGAAQLISLLLSDKKSLIPRSQQYSCINQLY